MFTRASRRRRSARLRAATQGLPHHTREAMLRGLEANQIIVGAYTDRDGGVCPMLAAHRNGGRTDVASFARAWDEFTGAGRRSRRATRRELRALRSYLELSLLADEGRAPSRTAAAPSVRPRDRFRVYDLRRLRRRARPPAAASHPTDREPARTP
jgi:hypothetical protein